MSGLLQLVGLVALAFLASATFGKSGRGTLLAGLFVLLGLLIGPLGLALVDEGVRPLWQPLTSLSATWLCLLFGVRLRLGGLRHAGARGLFAAAVEAGGSLALIAGGLWWLSGHLGLDRDLRVAVSVAIAGAASSRSMVSFARARLGANGAVTSWLDRLTGVDDLLPLIALLGLVVVWLPPHAPALFGRSREILPAATLGLGVLLAVVFSLAAGRAPTPDRAWVVLLGSLFLGAGLSAQLGMPEAVVGLVAGLALASVPHQRLLTRIVSATEQPVTLLLLVLIGARLTLQRSALELAALALLLRIAAKLLAGLASTLLARGAPGSRGARVPGLGLGLLGYGGLALAAAAQVDLLYGGVLGATVLVVAAVQAIAFDVLGPLGVSWLLVRAGEGRGGHAVEAVVGAVADV